MKTFLTSDDEQRLVEAIRRAEQGTRGEIRVCITSRWIWRPERYVRRLFDRFGMRQTRERNAALILVIPRRRRFVLYGDKGLDQVFAPGLWETLAAAMSDRFHAGDKVGALEAAIAELGQQLASHWPADSPNPNELPDDLLRD